MIVILPFSMLLYKLLLRRKLIVFLFIIGCILAITGKGFGAILVSISNYIPGILGKIIVRYVLNDSYNISHGLTIGFLERFLVFILVYHFQIKIEKDYPLLKIFIAFFYMFIFFSFYFIDFTIVIERVAAMFKISYWIIIPIIYKYLSKNNKYCFYFILIIYGLLKMYQQYNDSIYQVYWELLK